MPSRRQRPSKRPPRLVDPEMARLQGEIAAAKELLSKLEEQLDLRKLALINERLGTSHGDGDLVFGCWECEKSPTHLCVYLESDRYRDECLFCQEPEERG